MGEKIHGMAASPKVGKNVINFRYAAVLLNTTVKSCFNDIKQ